MPNFLNTILSPLLLGLSSGLYCLSYCLPFVAPFMVAEKRKFGKSLKIFFCFIAGRLIGYLIFGAVVGWLGWQFDSEFLNLLANLSLLLMSVLLILYALGLLKIKGRSFCAFKIPSKPVPFLLGLFSGINICPPFLFAINLVFTSHSIWYGVLFFGFFFLGTTIYMVPLIFFAPLGRSKIFRKLARLAGLSVGLIYLVYEIYYFYRAIFVFGVF